MKYNLFMRNQLLLLIVTVILVMGNKGLSANATNKWPSLAEVKQKWGNVPLEQIRQAAESGDLTAQHYLGYNYASGERLAKDATQAVTWYERALQSGYLPSANNLGLLYAKGEPVPQDWVKAFHYTRIAAEGGMAQGQMNLGVFYLNGTGAQQDYAEARRWFERAAEQGHASAMHELYLIYRNGKGVPQNDSEAGKWLAKSAEAGNALAQCELGYNFEYMDWNRYHEISNSNNMPAAIQWYQRSAEQNWSHGQYRLGLCYLVGKGVDWDEERGLELIRKAADQDNPYAISKLAELYGSGIGEPRSESDRPVNLLLRAAKMDFDEAYHAYLKLSERYQTGLGVERDMIKAAQWYCRTVSAGAYGYKITDKMVDAADRNPNGDPYSVALSLYLKATKLGNVEAMMRIGGMYFAGRDVPQNLIEAYAWFDLALNQGYSEAQTKLSQIETKMTSQQIESAKERVAELNTLARDIKKTP